MPVGYFCGDSAGVYGGLIYSGLAGILDGRDEKQGQRIPGLLGSLFAARCLDLQSV